MYNNKPRIFADFYATNDTLNKLRNNETVYKVILENYKLPIYSINGQDPFYYITNFGNEYSRLKSPYSTFVYKLANYKSYSLYSLPLSLEDLTNFTVVYDNNQTFTTDYLILSINPLGTTNDQQSSLNNDIKDTNSNLTKNNINAMVDNFEMTNIILGANTNSNGNNLKEEGLKWNYNYNNMFKCRVDDKNGANVYLVSRLGDSDIIDGFFQTIIQCVKLFDNNTYPLILINSMNPGGISSLAHILLELLSPKISLNMYGAYRKQILLKILPN